MSVRNFQARYSYIDEYRSVNIPNPLSGAAGDVFTDAAAYFGIARAAGSAAANQAIDNPNSPPFYFNQQKQAATALLPGEMNVGLLGKKEL